MSADFLWIYVTVFAAGLQTARTASQRLLAIASSAFIATYVRYVFGAPIAVMAACIAVWMSGRAPSFSFAWVLSLCLLGGIFQILGTVLLLHSFRRRSYAVGTVLSKTEAIQVALLSPLLLAEHLNPLAWAGVSVSFGGVLLLTLANPKGTTGLVQFDLTSAALGLGSGLLFALTSVCIRGSALAVEHPWSLVQALVVLAAMTTVQFVVMTPIALRSERMALRKALPHIRLAAWVGATSVLGSMGWFLAMTLENPAKVQTVGQVELVFALLVSRLWFQEKMSASELAGVVAVFVGIIAVLLSR
jgi:drug/metabolite transporter (DMT)-like permease